MRATLRIVRGAAVVVQRRAITSLWCTSVQFGSWLRARTFHTSVRPVPLRELVAVGGRVADVHSSAVRSLAVADKAPQLDVMAALCEETVSDGAQVRGSGGGVRGYRTPRLLMR
jgi:hypothetical protein